MNISQNACTQAERACTQEERSCIQTIKKSHEIKTPISIRFHTFPNGLRLVYENPKTVLPLTSVSVYCNVGSVNETNDLRGASHFIEHCIFKGTKKHPKAKQLYLFFDKVGGKINAYTEKRSTQYIIKVQDEYVAECIDLFGDMLLNSTFDPEECKKEEKVVVEEVLRMEDDPEDILANIRETILYSGTSYQYPIDTISYHRSGTKHGLKPFLHEKIQEFYRMFYRPENMIISIVSHLSFSHIQSVIEKSFFIRTIPKRYALPAFSRPISYYAKYQMHPFFSYELPLTRVENNKKRDKNASPIKYELHQKPNMETVHVSISFKTCGLFTNSDQCGEHIQHRCALNVLDNILSGTFGGKLSYLLREQNGLTYTSKTYTNYYEANGDITIYAQVDRNKVIRNGDRKGLIPLIVGLLRDLVKHGVSEQDVTVAKQGMKSSLMMQLEHSLDQAEHNGNLWLIYGNKHAVVPIDRLYETEIEWIKAKHIYDVIRTYFRPENMVVCLVGETLPSLNTVRREIDPFEGCK